MSALRVLSFAALILIAGTLNGCHAGGSGGADVAAKSIPPAKTAVDQAPAQAPAQPEVPNVAVDSVKPEESSQAPLNLDISAALQADAEASEDVSFEDKPALPNLFNNLEEERRVSTSAKLLMDPENPDQIKSVDGVEISIQKKL